MEEAAGDIVIDFKSAVAVVTVRVAVPLTVPIWAVIVVVPAAEPLARPVLLIGAAFASDELHCTELVTSFVVLSEK
jgi:hypothetical protein